MAYSSGGPPAGSSAAAGASAKLKSPDTAKEWDGKLQERVAAVLAAGKKVRFDFKALGTRITIQSLTGNGSFKAAMENGGQMDLSWPQLQTADFRSLALDLAAAQDTPADHALAAFYLLCDKDTAKAEEHLTKAGKESAAVHAAFAPN
jgi:hypothetical protein